MTQALVEKVLYGTLDPESPSPFGRGNLPAMTTMLYKITGQDKELFDEAMRLVTLFVQEAIDLTLSEVHNGDLTP